MHKNDYTNATAGGEYTDGNPALGIPRSLLGSKWLNTIQRELLAILTWVGIIATDTDDAQIAQAVQMHVATIAALKNMPVPSLGAGRSIVVNVRGYYADGDGGGGHFYWDPANTSTNDSGTVIQPATLPPTGRWVRQTRYNELDVLWFGADPTGVRDSYAAITLAFAAATAANGGKGAVLGFPVGQYKTSQLLAVPYNVSIWLDYGASITATVAMEAVLQTPLATVAQDEFIRGGFIYCNALANVGIDIQYAQSYYVTETCVEDFLVAGYRFGSTLSATSSYECRLYNARTHRRTAAVVANSIALYIRAATDCLVNNAALVGGETGVQVDSGCGGCYFEKVHPWVRTGLMKYAFIDNAGSRFVNCNADTPSIYGWWMKYHKGNILNCEHYNNPNKGLDNTPISVRFEHASPTCTVLNLYCHADGSGTHRIAQDFSFAGASSGVTLLGTQWQDCVLQTPQQLASNSLAALSTSGGVTAAGEVESSTGIMSLRAAAGVARDLSWYTSSGGGVGGATNGARFTARCTADAEGGGLNQGSNFQFISRNDDGSAKDTILQVTRSTGFVTLGGSGLSISGTLAVTSTLGVTGLTTLSGGANVTGNLTASGNITAGANAGGAVDLALNAAAGSLRDLLFQTAGSLRWDLRCTNTTESGSNAGSDFAILCRTDAGGSLYTPVSITRSTGVTTFNRAVAKAIATITYSASMTPDGNASNQQTITVTDANPFTVNNPSTATTGAILTIMVRNTNGTGNTGAATWGNLYKMAAWGVIANGFSRSITFRNDGTNWVEIGRTPTDVPN